MNYTKMRSLKNYKIVIVLLISILVYNCKILKIESPPTLPCKGYDKVIKSGRPHIIEFGNKWFGPSMANRNFLKDFWYKYRDEVDVYFVNVSDCDEIVLKYDIFFIPTILIFNKEGEEIFRWVGQWNKDDFYRVIKAMKIVKWRDGNKR